MGSGNFGLAVAGPVRPVPTPLKWNNTKNYLLSLWCVLSHVMYDILLSQVVTAFGQLPHSTRFKTLSLYITCSFDITISEVAAPISTYLKFIVTMAISSGGW